MFPKEHTKYINIYITPKKYPGSSEPTFLAGVNKAQRYTPIVVHVHMGLDNTKRPQ